MLIQSGVGAMPPAWQGTGEATDEGVRKVGRGGVRGRRVVGRNDGGWKTESTPLVTSPPSRHLTPPLPRPLRATRGWTED